MGKILGYGNDSASENVSEGITQVVGRKPKSFTTYARYYRNRKPPNVYDVPLPPVISPKETAAK